MGTGFTVTYELPFRIIVDDPAGIGFADFVVTIFLAFDDIVDGDELLTIVTIDFEFCKYDASVSG